MQMAFVGNKIQRILPVYVYFWSVNVKTNNESFSVHLDFV